MKNSLIKVVKDNLYVLLLVLIFIPFLLPFFHSGFPVGHDNMTTIARTAARISALSDGQFPPRWAADLNYSYGHPGFIVFYSLPAYLSIPFHYFGVGLETSYILLLSVCFIAAPITFYLWVSKIFGRENAFYSSIVY